MDLPRLVLIVGAAARLTRLTTRDAITSGLREKIRTRVLFDPEQRKALRAGKPIPPPRSKTSAQIRVKVQEGLSCDWCVGVWWCAAITAAHHLTGRRRAATVLDAGLTALTAAYAVGLLAEYESPEPAVVLGDDRHNT